MWFVYILRCADNSFYIGISTDIEKRIQKHNLGTASKYTKARVPVKLVYFERYPDKSAALKRERQLKKLPRSKKEALIILRPS